MPVVALLLACTELPIEEPGTPEVTETADSAVATDTSPPGTSDTAPPADTGPPVDTSPTLPWDCAALPAPPLASAALPDLYPAEDFAFDDQGNLISHHGDFFWKQAYPPGSAVPWSPTPAGGTGPASARMLETGDLVYHNVDTSTLYRVEPNGGSVNVYSGFGYAGGIEVHPTTGWIYVVDIVGLHHIEPYTQEHEVWFAAAGSAPWLSPNGITLSADWTTLFVSARNGIFAIPVDAAGEPTAPPTLWAASPPDSSELLGMGADACGNVYVVGKAWTPQNTSRLWRYPAAGGTPEVLLDVPGGWLSNLQWGSGIGGWDPLKLYVVDQYAQAGGYHEIDVGVGEKPR